MGERRIKRTLLNWRWYLLIPTFPLFLVTAAIITAADELEILLDGFVSWVREGERK